MLRLVGLPNTNLGVTNCAFSDVGALFESCGPSIVRTFIFQKYSGFSVQKKQEGLKAGFY